MREPPPIGTKVRRYFGRPMGPERGVVRAVTGMGLIEGQARNIYLSVEIEPGVYRRWLLSSVELDEDPPKDDDAT